jgi:hypothetical protein
MREPVLRKHFCNVLGALLKSWDASPVDDSLNGFVADSDGAAYLDVRDRAPPHPTAQTLDG